MRSVTTQPSQPPPAIVCVITASLPPNVVPSCGIRTIVAITAHTRFVMIDIVRAKLRIIHRRCSTSRRWRAMRSPVIVNVSQRVARRTLLTRITGPKGLMAPTVKPMPAGTPPRFPAIAAVLAAGVFEAPDDQDPDAEFNFGLERILDGVAALLRKR